MPGIILIIIMQIEILSNIILIRNVCLIHQLYTPFELWSEDGCEQAKKNRNQRENIMLKNSFLCLLLK